MTRAITAHYLVLPSFASSFLHPSVSLPPQPSGNSVEAELQGRAALRCAARSSAVLHRGSMEEPCGAAEGGSGAKRSRAGGSGDDAADGGDWMAAHPTFTAMMSLDISNSSQIYAAFLVYLDLLEGRSWHEVKHVGLAELQLVCLHAREKEQADLQVMVPIPADVLVSHERLREIMKKAALPPDNPDTPLSITLAIVETDSTIVYYKMTDGFVLPEPPDDTEDVDNKQWKRKRRKLSKS